MGIYKDFKFKRLIGGKLPLGLSKVQSYYNKNSLPENRIYI